MVADGTIASVSGTLAASVRTVDATGARLRLVPLALCFASGFSALAYQVLWMRQVGQLFGSTAYTAAMTLGVFFLGLALGSWFWGRRVGHTRSPIRTYAWLEAWMVVAASGYFLLLDTYYGLYGALFTQLHGSPALLLAAKTVLATTMLLPAAILMGGTLPVLVEFVVRRNDQIASEATRLYAINTIGAAAGALAAGFYLPQALGYRGSYVFAMGINAAVAAAALLLYRADRDAADSSARTWVRKDDATQSQGEASSGRTVLQPKFVYAFAFCSGAATLALEVLWTTMFAQVLHNSVYSFASILVVFLIALSIGSMIAHRLCRQTREPQRTLVVLLTIAGFAVVLVPFAFHGITGGMEYVAATSAWSRYVAIIFATVAAVILAPAALTGILFPYTLRLGQTFGLAAGATTGQIAAANTLGAIVGSVLGGFVLLPALGLWASIKAIGLAYLAAAALLAQTRHSMRIGWRIAPIAGLFVFSTLVDSAALGIVRTDPDRNEIVYETWQGAHGVVAVVKRDNDLRIKVDNYYSLGGTAAATYERTQADLPLVIHGGPRSAFFMGLGTGITAGASLAHPLEKITVAELIPEVVEASKRHFKSHIGELFEDPRVRIVVEDARNYLLGTDDRYDVIIADLFIPWQSGAANIYTVEHFEAVRDRLERNGLFAQWLPLYQLSLQEYSIIAKSMLEVFPQVTIWRGDFEPHRPIVALIGQNEARPLDVGGIVEGFRRRRQDSNPDRHSVMATTALFYAGDASADAPRLEDYELNTDDRPVIEYVAPITQRQVRGGKANWFLGPDLLTYFAELAEARPPQDDPFLSNLTAEEVGFVVGGRHLFASKWYQRMKDDEKFTHHLGEYNSRMPAFMLDPSASARRATP